MINYFNLWWIILWKTCTYNLGIITSIIYTFYIFPCFTSYSYWRICISSLVSYCKFYWHTLVHILIPIFTSTDIHIDSMYYQLCIIIRPYSSHIFYITLNHFPDLRLWLGLTYRGAQYQVVDSVCKRDNRYRKRFFRRSAPATLHTCQQVSQDLLVEGDGVARWHVFK